MRFLRLVWTLLFACVFQPNAAQAFKIGYRGIPVVVKDFPPVHEAVTAEAVRHFCHAEGLAALQSSPLYRARGNLRRCAS